MAHLPINESRNIFITENILMDRKEHSMTIYDGFGEGFIFHPLINKDVGIEIQNSPGGSAIVSSMLDVIFECQYPRSEATN